MRLLIHLSLWTVGTMAAYAVRSFGGWPALCAGAVWAAAWMMLGWRTHYNATLDAIRAARKS